MLYQTKNRVFWGKRMRWSKLFVGRERELSTLIEAYDEAAKGSTKIVSIVAESGFGKTRLAQEFYNWLSVDREPAGDVGYWPDLLERFENNLTVNPPAELCGQTDSLLPYLWWGLRISDPGMRNETIAGALWSGVSTLTPHLARHKKEVERRELSIETAKAGAKGATSIGFDILGNVMTFGLLGIGKSVVESGIDLYKIKRQHSELFAKDMAPEQVADEANIELSDTIISDLELLAKKPIGDASPVPIVILLDDAQWLDKDEGALKFFEQLITKARDESWPLLIIVTCWEKEWHNSAQSHTAPAKWCNPERGDNLIMLGPAKGLDQLVSDSFVGLTDSQVSNLLIQADGNPRFLDELLMFLERNPKYFQGRDQSASLSKKGEAKVSEMNFSDLVLDRFESAPDNVRQILSLSSIQGTRFSPRIANLMAEVSGVKDSEAAILSSETPFGFIDISEDSQGSEKTAQQAKELHSTSAEFRLNAYRVAAFNDLENHIDEDEARKHFSDARKNIFTELETASNVDLEILTDFVEDDPIAAIEAAAELIKRANQNLDSQTAANVAARFLPVLENLPTPPKNEAIENILEIDIEETGVKPHHLEIIDRYISYFKEQGLSELEVSEIKNLAGYYRLQGSILQMLEGPVAAKASFESAEKLARKLASDLNTLEARKDLVFSVFNLADVIHDIDGSHQALPYYTECKRLIFDLVEEFNTSELRTELAYATFSLARVTGGSEGPGAAKKHIVECERLMRSLAKELKTPMARTNLAQAVYHLGNITEQTDGPAAAKPYFVESERLRRSLAEELETPKSRENLAHAISHLASNTQQTDGSSAAKPYFVEYERLMRGLAEELKTPKSRENLASAVYHLANNTLQTDGPAAAKHYFLECERLTRDLAEELKTPESRENLARAVYHLADNTLQTAGPAAAKPYFLECERLTRDLAEELKTPALLTELASSVYLLGNITQQIDGAPEARPYFFEYERLMRGLAEELETPEARKNLANAVYHLASNTQQTEGPAAARPYFLENEHLKRGLAEELETPEARKNLANAVYHLADVTEQTEGPDAAKPYFVESERLMRGLAEELETPESRTSLANALYLLGGIIQQIEGPATAKSYIVESVRLLRSLAEDLETPESRTNLASAVFHLASNTQQTEGPEAAKTYFVECEQLMRSVAEELETPASRENLAFALHHLAEITQKTEGPAAAKPYAVEYERLMRGLTEELNTPKSRENLAFALHHLAEITQKTEGPAAAKPYAVEYERLMRGLTEELNTPKSRENRAFALHQLAEITQQTEGPAAAKPYFVEYEHLMRSLAEELKTPESGENLSFALYHLASITQKTEGPLEAEPYFIESERLMRVLARDLDTPTHKYLLAVTSLARHQNDAILQNKTMIPFVVEFPELNFARTGLDTLIEIENTFKEYSSTVHLDTSEVLWFNNVGIELSRYYFLLGEFINAKEKINEVVNRLAAHTNLGEQKSLQQLVVAYCLQARIAQQALDFNSAEENFIRAEETLNDMHSSYWDFGYYQALVWWFYAAFLRETGEADRADILLKKGTDAAKSFARFKVLDGPAILAAYEKEREVYIADIIRA